MVYTSDSSNFVRVGRWSVLGFLDLGATATRRTTALTYSSRLCPIARRPLVPFFPFLSFKSRFDPFAAIGYEF